MSSPREETSIFKPISVQCDYRYLSKLGRVNYIRKCPGFIDELENVVQMNEMRKTPPRTLITASVTPVDNINHEETNAKEMRDMTYLCRILAISGFSDNISDTLTYRLDESGTLTTPFGVLWSVLQSSMLLKVHKNQQVHDSGNLYGYNALFHKLTSSILFKLPEFSFVAFLCSPLFVSTSLKECVITELSRLLPELGNISYAKKTSGGGIDLDDLIDLISYSTPILFVAGLGVLVCSKSAEGLYYCVRDLASFCDDLVKDPIHRQKIEGYSFEELKDVLDKSEKRANGHINCHADVKIPGFSATTGECGKVCQTNSVDNFVPLETDVNEFRRVRDNILSKKSNSITKTEAKENNPKGHKENNGLLSRISFKWLYSKS